MAFLAALPAIIGAAGAGLGALGKPNKARTTQLQRFTSPQQGVLNQALGGFQQQLPSAFSYLHNLLGDNQQEFDAFEAPYKRQFNEQTIPGLANLFGGLGAQSSSAFNQALGGAGAGLSERLASLRSGLKSSALQQLMHLGGIGLEPQFESYYEPESPGGLQRFGAALSGGLGSGLQGLGQYGQMRSLAKMFGRQQQQEHPGYESILDQIGGELTTGPSGQGAHYDWRTGVQS